MDSAVKLVRLGLGNHSRQPELRITITGGLSAAPGIPGLEDFSPAMQRDLLWIKRCYELGIEDPDIDNWNIKKGHGCHDPDELFAIVPVEGKSPDEAICIGPMSEVFTYIGQSIPRIEEEQRLAKAQLDAKQIAQHQAETRACALQILGDGVTRLHERIDAFQARKKERAEQLQRAEVAAEAMAIEEYLESLPDPDEYTMGDDGELEAIKPPPDTEKHDPEHRNETATGLTTPELEETTPPEPGDYSLTGSPPSRYRNPAAIGGN